MTVQKDIHTNKTAESEKPAVIALADDAGCEAALKRAIGRTSPLSDRARPC
jgi:hypothetical protein